MAASSVEYYEKLGHLQDIQRESEQKRLFLEQELNAYVRSDQRLAKLQAARLQNYWKKICDDEKKSQWRNEQLLKDFERVEAQVAVLNARTHKLTEMKRQYEDYIERSYPQWKEKVTARQRMKSQPRPPAAAVQGTFTLSQPDHVQPQYHASMIRQEHPRDNAEYLSTTIANSTMQTVSSLQTGLSLTTTQEGLLKAYSTASAVGGETLNTTGFASWHDPHDRHPDVGDSVTSPKTVMRGGEGHQDGDLDTWRSETSQHSTSHHTATPTSHHTATPKSMSVGRVSSQHSAASRHSERHNSTIGDDVEDLGEESLPLSSRGDQNSTHRSPERQSPQRVLSREHSRESIAEERPVYPEADITLDGLYNMLTGIQEALPGIRTTHELYQAMSPALSVRNDIIQNANRGAMLSHVDPSSISMVVLEQLPMVVNNCEGSCLLPDKMLFSPHASVSENYVRSQIHPACREFWGHMYDHMVLLIKHRAMQAPDIAEIFGPLLIDEESPYEQKAKTVLVSVLEDVEPEEGLASPNSTATLSSMAVSPPHRPHKEPEQPALTEHSESKSRSEEGEDFFSQPVPAANTNSLPMGSLTHSMAYKRMLGETGSTQKTISYEESEESEDDIEKALSMGGTSRMDKSATAISPAPAQAPMSPARRDESEESSPPLSPAYIPSAVEQSKSPLSTLQSTGKSVAKKNPAFMYGDTDTEEEIEIPGADTTDASKHAAESDDFEFYG